MVVEKSDYIRDDFKASKVSTGIDKVEGIKATWITKQ